MKSVSQPIPGVLSGAGVSSLLRERLDVSMWVAFGWFLIVPLLSWLTWGHPLEWREAPYLGFTALLTVAFMAALVVTTRMGSFPRSSGLRYFIFNLIIAWALVGIWILADRGYYSRSFMAFSWLGAVVWAGSVYLVAARRGVLRLALVDGGISDDIARISDVNWVPLESPQLNEAVDGVVVDLQVPRDADWIRFLSDCSVSGIPVYHAAHVYEGVHGRVSVEHIQDGLLDNLFMLRQYRIGKRLIDIGVVLATLPLTLTLGLLIAVAVRMDSPGPVIYVQERVGRRGRGFRLYKFRSMVDDAGPDRFAEIDDQRVTRTGRLLRRFRLDELPQLWNVLRGDMSLIGPRPEQVSFVEEFERRLPCYSCRHLLRPGLTGWAQVNAGYAAGEAETAVKLEYDLYYIKHLSVWLDLLILWKTLRFVLAGEGSR